MSYEHIFNSTVKCSEELTPNEAIFAIGLMVMAVDGDIDMNNSDKYFYSDLRKYGNGMSSGMGMGFERLLMLLTGSNNIKDCISFPRFPYNIFG